MSVLVPSEVIIPGFAVVIVLFIITLSIIGIISISLSTAINTLRENYEISYKRLSSISMQQVSVNYSNGLLELNITIFNNGPHPLYKFEACDLIVEYYSTSGSLKSVILHYNLNWTVEKVILVENYSISFTEQPIINSGEAGLIKGLATIEDIDVEKPLRVVFTTQYGTADSKWVIISAQS